MDNFDQNDFEEFLREQVRNHRMYPQDDVWQEINKKLHGEKKWPALTIAALTLITATIAICVYFTPHSNILSLTPSIEPIAGTKPTAQTNEVLDKLTSSAPFAKDKSSSAVVESSASVGTSQSQNIHTGSKTTGAKITDQIIETGENVKSAIGRQALPSNVKQANQVNIHPLTTTLINAETPESDFTVQTLPLNSTTPPVKKQPASEKPKIAKEYNDKNMVDAFLKEQPEDVSIHTTPKSRSLKNKFSFQVYAAPSVSYRSLIEDRSILKGDDNGPVGLNYVTDVNKVVRHKPGVGIEAGLALMYNLSEKVRLKSGLQFNIRQYSIEAYRSSLQLASIALLENNHIDTVNTFAVYRTGNGFYSTEIVNRYFQISTPLGIEWEVTGNRKIQFNVAASIQPTYLLNRNAYLLSTNFKNYTENPDIIRRWNINSNIEAFLTFKSGSYKWQLGPQLRYQPYSTFIRQYPIKEHLMDYGIKLGISRVIN